MTRAKGETTMTDFPYPVQIVKAREFVRPHSRGGSRPLLLRLDDGRIAHVKFQHNPQTTRSLVNDLIGSLLGHLLNAPVPEVVLVDVPGTCRAQMPYLTHYRWLPGLQFGTIYYEEAIPLKNAKQVPALSNWHDLPLCALLESWLFNKDVKFSHILALAQGEALRFMIIDHGFIFPGGPLWSIHSLKSYRREFPLLYPFNALAWQIPHRFEFHSALNQIQDLSSHDLTEVVDMIPKEWGLSSASKSAVVEFLVYRQKKLGKVAQHLESLWNRHKPAPSPTPLGDAQDSWENSGVAPRDEEHPNHSQSRSPESSTLAPVEDGPI